MGKRSRKNSGDDSEESRIKKKLKKYQKKLKSLEKQKEQENFTPPHSRSSKDLADQENDIENDDPLANSGSSPKILKSKWNK